MIVGLLSLAAGGCGAPTPTLPPPPQLPPCDEGLRLPHDELRVFLLTMPPGDALWSVFGHNGLWISKPGGAGDRVYNYGVIDGRQPDLLGGFLRGTLDYLLGTRSVESMVTYYGRQGRSIAAQRLALPAPAAAALVARLEREAQPDRRSYRYHWTDRNCATRIRDLLDEVLGGQLRDTDQTARQSAAAGVTRLGPRHFVRGQGRQASTAEGVLPYVEAPRAQARAEIARNDRSQLRAQHRGPSETTARAEVLRHLGPHPLLWFGWHLVVSAAADQPLDRWRRVFMPDRLYHLIDQSTLRDAAGQAHPLVAERCELLAGAHSWPPTAPPQRDLALWLIGLALAAAVTGSARWATHRRAARPVFAGLVGLLGLLGGALGSISAWLWAESQLAGFHGSLNLLVANPLTFGLLIVALAPLTRSRRLATVARWTTRALATLALTAVAAIPFATQPIAGPVGLFAPTLLALPFAWRAGAARFTRSPR